MDKKLTEQWRIKSITFNPYNDKFGMVIQSVLTGEETTLFRDPISRQIKFSPKGAPSESSNKEAVLPRRR